MAGAKGRSGRKPSTGSLAKLTIEARPPARVIAPKGLTAPARKEYIRVVKLLVGRQHWREDFSGLVAIYAQAWADWLQARESIDSAGLLIRSPKGEPIENPYNRVAERAEIRMIGVAGQMGMSLVGLSRTLRSRSRERVLVEDGKVGIERESWDEDLLA